MPPTLIAEFRTPGEARAAIEALENHGIDGVEIAISSFEDSGRQPADRRTLMHMGGRVGKGTVAGAIVGAAVFAVVGVVFLVVGWPVGAAVALILAGAAIGGTAGAFIGVERGVGMSEGWEQTFHEPDTMTASVAVYAPTAAKAARAQQVLENHRPVSLRDTNASTSRR